MPHIQSSQPGSPVQSPHSPPPAFHVSPVVVQDAARALDQNGNGYVTPDEARFSPATSKEIDSNHDGRLHVYEIYEAVLQKRASLENLSPANAHAVAGQILAYPATVASLGRVGYHLDADQNRMVTQNELARGFEQGRVFLRGNQVGLNEGGGAIADIEAARSFIQSIKDSTMMPDSIGFDNPDTGFFSPAEARERIQRFLSRDVIPSPWIPLGDKLDLIRENLTRPDASGFQDPRSGSLNHSEAQGLARQSIDAFELHRPEDAREALAAISANRMQKDDFNFVDPASGLFTSEEANQAIASLLETEILPSYQLSPGEKLSLIREHSMKTDAYGFLDPATGALDTEKARRLSKRILDRPGF